MELLLISSMLSILICFILFETLSGALMRLHETSKSYKIIHSIIIIAKLILLFSAVLCAYLFFTI